MRLSTLYPQLSGDQRRELARAVNVSDTYLWQIATRWRGKRASIDLIEKLATVDHRLHRTDMLAEFTEPAPVVAAAD